MLLSGSQKAAPAEERHWAARAGQVAFTAEEVEMSTSTLAVMFIDVYKSTPLKLNEEQVDVDRTFAAYHAVVEQALAAYGGTRWHDMGDGAIYTFPDSRLAVGGAVRLLGDLPSFDRDGNHLQSSIHVRIGIGKIAASLMQGVPAADRGQRPAGDLDIAGKLEKNCPVGKIAISREVMDDLDNVLQALFREAAVGSLAKSSAFILEHRNAMSREQVLARGLSFAQSSRLPPIPFRTWSRLRPPDAVGLRQLQEILREPLLVVLGETSDDAHSAVRAAATSDAVGVIELLSAIRMNTDVTAGIDRWADTADIACDRSLLLVGSAMVNSYAFAFNDLVRPVRFSKADDRAVDRIVVESANETTLYGSHAANPRDCGFVALFRSPVNPDKHVVWIAGVTGMGTQAAARLAFDLVCDAEDTIRERLGSADFNPIACVVGATTPSGSSDISEYYRRWRVANYAIEVGIDGAGRAIRKNRSQRPTRP